MQIKTSRSWYFFFCATEGLVALLSLFMIPSEGGTISLARLGLIGIILLVAGSWIYLGVRPPRRLDDWATPIVVLSLALLSLTLSLLLFFLRYLDPEVLLSIYERLSPLLWYLLILSIQSIFYLLYIRNGLRFDFIKQQKPVYVAMFVAFGFLLFVFLLILLTRQGLTPDPAYWGEPGVAILGWQFVLALLGGILVLVLSLRWKNNMFDVFIPVSIYIVAVAVWLSVPLDVLANGFYVTMDPPTFQPFPYSDAGYYDRTAQSLLIGHRYFGEIPTRPLFMVFLAFLHKVFSENYPGIIFGQTLVLAGIPVTLYFLGKKIHSRTAGATVALLFIFRELTSLFITSNTRVTNTKSLLVDLPTLFLLLLSCHFTMRWLERRDSKGAFIAGGMFGLLLLLRTQSMLILPFILLAALLVFGWRNRLFYQFSGLLIIGMIAAITPWLTRNYVNTGQFAFDADSQYKLIASQYAYSGNLDIANYDFQGKGLGQVLIEFAIKDPEFVFGFIANHFLAIEIHGLLALPLIQTYNGIREPVNLYWMTWDGNLEWYNLLLMFLYLVVIALGLGAAWKRLRWIGLLPLAYNIGYALATAIGRYSGWRYDFPADWVPYFYFGIGFAEAIGLISSLFGAKAEPLQGINGYRQGRIPIPVYLIIFAFIGAVPWMAEKIAAPRYADQSPAFLYGKIASISTAPSRAGVEAFVSQPGTFFQMGRVVYPRYFSRDRGLFSSNPWPAFRPRDYPRLGFLLLNQKSINAIFPSREIPQPFPHAADAIVIGCQRDGYVEVRMIAFPELDAVLLSAPLSEPCSP